MFKSKKEPRDAERGTDSPTEDLRPKSVSDAPSIPAGGARDPDVEKGDFKAEEPKREEGGPPPSANDDHEKLPPLLPHPEDDRGSIDENRRLAELQKEGLRPLSRGPQIVDAASPSKTKVPGTLDGAKPLQPSRELRRLRDLEEGLRAALAGDGDLKAKVTELLDSGPRWQELDRQQAFAEEQRGAWELGAKVTQVEQYCQHKGPTISGRCAFCGAEVA